MCTDRAPTFAGFCGHGNPNGLLSEGGHLRTNLLLREDWRAGGLLLKDRIHVYNAPRKMEAHLSPVASFDLGTTVELCLDQRSCNHLHHLLLLEAILSGETLAPHSS